MLVRVDTEKLWELYSKLNNIVMQADETCEDLSNTVSNYFGRIRQDISKSKSEIQTKQDEIAAESSKEHPNRGKIAALNAEIQELQSHIERLMQYERLLGEKAGGLKRNAAEYRSSFRTCAQIVNRYLQLVEKALGASAVSTNSAEVKIAGGTASGVGGNTEIQRTGLSEGYKRFGCISFRGMSFHTDDSLFDVGDTTQGRKNAARMKKGYAPIGYDGKPVNLHHSSQSETGGILEVSATQHSQNHGTLHVNGNDIPSGINRKSFNSLRRAYWKQRIAAIERGF